MNDGSTHWEDCWLCPEHHACAVARVRELERILAEDAGAARGAIQALEDVVAEFAKMRR